MRYSKDYVFLVACILLIIFISVSNVSAKSSSGVYDLLTSSKVGGSVIGPKGSAGGETIGPPSGGSGGDLDEGLLGGGGSTTSGGPQNTPNPPAMKHVYAPSGQESSYPQHTTLVPEDYVHADVSSDSSYTQLVASSHIDTGSDATSRIPVGWIHADVEGSVQYTNYLPASSVHMDVEFESLYTAYVIGVHLEEGNDATTWVVPGWVHVEEGLDLNGDGVNETENSDATNYMPAGYVHADVQESSSYTHMIPPAYFHIDDPQGIDGTTINHANGSAHTLYVPAGSYHESGSVENGHQNTYYFPPGWSHYATVPGSPGFTRHYPPDWTHVNNDQSPDLTALLPPEYVHFAYSGPDFTKYVESGTQHATVGSSPTSMVGSNYIHFDFAGPDFTKYYATPMSHAELGLEATFAIPPGKIHVDLAGPSFTEYVPQWFVHLDVPEESVLYTTMVFGGTTHAEAVPDVPISALIFPGTIHVDLAYSPDYTSFVDEDFESFHMDMYTNENVSHVDHTSIAPSSYMHGSETGPEYTRFFPDHYIHLDSPASPGAYSTHVQNPVDEGVWF